MEVSDRDSRLSTATDTVLGGYSISSKDNGHLPPEK